MSDKIRLDPGQLTMADLRRAKIVLQGQNPLEVLDDPIEAIVLTIWCLRSRDDPEFTMADAAMVPLEDFEVVGDEDEPDPPSPVTPSSSGSPAGNEPSRTPRPSRNSATSSTSPSTSTSG